MPDRIFQITPEGRDDSVTGQHAMKVHSEAGLRFVADVFRLAGLHRDPTIDFGDYFASTHSGWFADLADAMDRYYPSFTDTDEWVLLTHRVLHWQQSATKVFRFSRILSEMLGHSEFKIPFSAIRLPFECAYYSFDIGDIVMSTGDRIAGGFISFIRNIPSSSVVALGPHRQLMKRALNISLDSVPRSPSDAGSGFAVTIDVSDCRDDEIITSDWLLSKIRGAPLDDIEDSRLAFSLLMNGILYLTSPDPDIANRIAPSAPLIARLRGIKSSKKRAKLEREIASLSSLDYIAVGENIRLPAKTIMPGDGTHGGWHLHNRHIVRGHWKMQPCGEGLEERRHIWIRPYIRGPEGTPVKNKGYIVTTAGEESS